MLYSGQKVVCIDAKPRPESDNEETGLTEGAVYTVLRCWENPLYGGLGVTLHELDPGPQRMGWYADRFRPAVEPKTNISIFRRMLKTRKKLVDA